MDPTISRTPSNWRRYGRLALYLLVTAVAAGVSGWLVSARGGDPGVAYRLAALLGAGAALMGIIWAGSAGERAQAEKEAR